MGKGTSKTRKKILESAATLIMQQGAQNTSLAEIAETAGLSKGTLYYYYPTKTDLIFDITEDHMQQVTRDLYDWAEKQTGKHNCEEVIKVVINNMVSAKHRARLHLYLIQEAILFDPSLTERFRKRYKEWRSMLERGLQRILREDQDPEFLSQIIIVMIDGLLLQNLLKIPGTSTRKTIKYLLK